MDSALSQIVERVRASASEQRPLRLRGGGTKEFHGGVAPYGEGLDVLDLRPLAGIVSYEPSELVVTARAGTPLAELEALLAAQGQCLPFEPPHFSAGATVGGMVAAGLSGPARASVGAVRDYVLGLELVNGRAQLLRFGGQVMKNVAGYDVSRLMVGAWGTLGAITEVSLKVLPVPPAEATLRFACNQADALRRLHAWGGQPLPLNASCWVDEGGGTGVLYVRLRGATAAVQAACRSMGGERQDNAVVAADWNACRDHTLPWFAARPPGHALWRLSVPATAPVLVLPTGVALPLLEWHGALRWVQAAPEHAEALRAAARAAGGDATLFIASSAYPSSATGTFCLNSPALTQIHTRLRQAFDPAGIFNPHRLGAA
ncbi:MULTISPECIES: glycolate oxidase subunit GlcE [unclassified Acidovorax]|uniref:glycolate oxidase subunit GlcE n=1 Tax=unclassified Acidovorax TaxID=2684926 RepID=UPI0028833384|nr:MULTISPECIES: glycolate oxidase subunit GlcE [unclassified Acidovorax]